MARSRQGGDGDDHPRLEFVAARRFLDSEGSTEVFDSLVALGQAAGDGPAPERFAKALLIRRGDPNAARLIAYGGPLTVSQINFNPELPSYTLANFRFGLKTQRWQAAAYINNIADKSAQLALDYERGRSARVGYLTNQPRTIGVYGSYNF